MPRPSNSLFPEDIRSDVVSPYTMLLTQAEALAEQTKGILAAEVSLVDVPDEQQAATFDVVAPHLGYHFRALRAVYRKALPYPVTLEADYFKSKGSEAIYFPGPPPPPEVREQRVKPMNEAASDLEFSSRLKMVFESSEFKALLISLIARSNEVLREKEQQALTPASAGSANEETPSGSNGPRE
jgi:hypothetical protein